MSGFLGFMAVDVLVDLVNQADSVDTSPKTYFLQTRPVILALVLLIKYTCKLYLFFERHILLFLMDLLAAFKTVLILITLLLKKQFNQDIYTLTK